MGGNLSRRNAGDWRNATGRDRLRPVGIMRSAGTRQYARRFVMPAELAQVTTASLIETLELYHNEVRDLVAPLSEAEFWDRPVDPGNSIGHLVLHLTGNLNHFIGAQLGGTGYVRDREREFTETNKLSKAEALACLDDAV